MNVIGVFRERGYTHTKTCLDERNGYEKMGFIYG